jgi:O-6-methylguanine DNA methyltransferase
MNTFLRATFDTPVGPMMALATDRALAALEFVNPKRSSRLETRLRRWRNPFQMVEGSNAVIDGVHAWLDAYFAGTHADVSPLTLDAPGGDFERRVWAELCRIQAGETRSYGEVAKLVGAPGAARAVGLANGANPIAIIVPCHRVIGANGTLTGYGGGLERKAWLLNHERRWRNALPLWLTDDLRKPASASVHPNGG